MGIAHHHFGWTLDWTLFSLMCVRFLCVWSTNNQDMEMSHVSTPQSPWILARVVGSVHWGKQIKSAFKFLGYARRNLLVVQSLKHLKSSKIWEHRDEKTEASISACETAQRQESKAVCWWNEEVPDGKFCCFSFFKFILVCTWWHGKTEPMHGTPGSLSIGLFLFLKIAEKPWDRWREEGCAVGKRHVATNPGPEVAYANSNILKLRGRDQVLSRSVRMSSPSS